MNEAFQEFWAVPARRRLIKCDQLEFVVGAAACQWFQIVPAKQKRVIKLWISSISVKNVENVSIIYLHCILQSIDPLFSFSLRFHVQRKRCWLCLAGQQQLEFEARIFTECFATERRFNAIVGQIMCFAEWILTVVAQFRGFHQNHDFLKDKHVAWLGFLVFVRFDVQIAVQQQMTILP